MLKWFEKFFYKIKIKLKVENLIVRNKRLLYDNIYNSILGSELGTFTILLLYSL